jgi:hypothetical protein
MVGRLLILTFVCVAILCLEAYAWPRRGGCADGQCRAPVSAAPAAPAPEVPQAPVVETPATNRVAAQTVGLQRVLRRAAELHELHPKWNARQLATQLRAEMPRAIDWAKLWPVLLALLQILLGL